MDADRERLTGWLHGAVALAFCVADPDQPVDRDAAENPSRRELAGPQPRAGWDS